MGKKEIDKLRIHAHAVIWDLDLEEVGVVHYTGTTTLVKKMEPVGISSSYGGSSYRGHGGLEKEAEIPYKVAVSDEAGMADIEERLAAMANQDYCTPIRLEVYNKVGDLKPDSKPDFSGFADGAKLEELGIIAGDGKQKLFIRVYDDSILMPGQFYRAEKKEEPKFEPKDKGPEPGKGSEPAGGES